MLRITRRPKQAYIYSRISGGLGNQIFQYAAGRFLAEKNNAKLCLRYQQIGRTKRRFELDRYNIQARIANRADVLRLHWGGFDRQMGRLFQKLGMRYSTFIPMYTENRARAFDPEFKNVQASVQLHGLWQNEKYFAPIRDRLINELSYDGPINKQNADMLHSIVSSESVGVHIRRDDYIKYGDRFGVLSADYYNKALATIKDRVERPHFFVFTLDLGWAKEHLKFPGDVTFVDINSSANGFMDLELMKHCKHHIIANSSFSWWGAWLSQNPNKVVIAPLQWLKSDVYDEAKKGYLREVIPESWIKIDSHFE